MNSSLVITVVGPDKPGIVDEVAQVIKDHDGNWLSSRLAHLGGQFAGMLEVEIAADQQAALAKALDAIDNLSIQLADASNGSGSDAGQHLAFDVIGQDRPGIVSEVAHLLSTLNVNVEELATKVEPAAMAGGNLFVAEITAGLPSGLSTDELISRLESLSDDIQVNVVE